MAPQVGLEPTTLRLTAGYNCPHGTPSYRSVPYIQAHTLCARDTGRYRSTYRVGTKSGTVRPALACALEDLGRWSPATLAFPLVLSLRIGGCLPSHVARIVRSPTSQRTNVIDHIAFAGPTLAPSGRAGRLPLELPPGFARSRVAVMSRGPRRMRMRCGPRERWEYRDGQQENNCQHALHGFAFRAFAAFFQGLAAAFALRTFPEAMPAFRASSRRSSAESFPMRIFPPRRPSATA
jgi:hypothetical protein